MQFLLLSRFPRVQEARAHYDTMLVLHPREAHPLGALWRRLKTLVS
ncbi:hypothetical protein [Paraburkholderia antibiotica]|uniref:Uncharacterized protein n=1 Tax=Paraburkholderia antibiotica TaxID=2728839 RepID=A0A7X9X4W4_9BURK|nr:hypothetical protein [Paraburkholderia antibiotica]NML31455.1 hypothetical protein [Paraburkholderia antibiotica]